MSIRSTEVLSRVFCGACCWDWVRFSGGLLIHILKHVILPQSQQRLQHSPGLKSALWCVDLLTTAGECTSLACCVCVCVCVCVHKNENGIFVFCFFLVHNKPLMFPPRCTHSHRSDKKEKKIQGLFIFPLKYDICILFTEVQSHLCFA